MGLAATLAPDKALALMKLIIELSDLNKAASGRTRERPPRRTKTPPPTFKIGQRVRITTETVLSKGAIGRTGKIIGRRGDVQWDIQLDSPLPSGQMVTYRKYSTLVLLPDIDA